MHRLATHILVAVVTLVLAAGLTVAILFATMPQCGKDEPAVGPHMDAARPIYHYTPRYGWVNDPNGLVYYKGEWHMYYQHDYETIKHGNMSWGHAVSTDLVHWQELPLAITYDLEEQIFSGSAVVDTDCTSGLCATPNQPVLVAVYTSFRQKEPHYQRQHIAHSSDLGRTWTKYSGNPVLDRNLTDFRDPYVLRYGDKWLMMVQKSAEQVLEFYHSTDLKSWGEAVGTFGKTGADGGVWECPDMFPLAVDGDLTNRKWVLLVNINPGNRIAGSATQFWIGQFNGTTFVRDTEYDWLDWGMDNYATITFNNAPDGQRVSIGWMSNWAYSEITPAGSGQWRNTFTTPRELKLKTIDGKVRLTQMPVRYLDTLHQRPVVQEDKVMLTDATHGLIHGAAADIQVTFTNTDATEFGVKVLAGDGQETLVGYDVATKAVFIDRSKSGNVTFHPKFADQRHSAPFDLRDGNVLKLRVMVDHGSVEAFAGEGERAITDVVFPDLTKDGISFYAKGGTVRIDSYSVWHMKSIHGNA